MAKQAKGALTERELTEQQVINNFIEMTKKFKTKADGLLSEITSAFNSSLECSVANYLELQGSYIAGYNKIISGSKQANTDLISSLDKNFSDFKSQIKTTYDETQSKANDAVDKSAQDFRTQCEECIKKMPSLPESAYKDVISVMQDSKIDLNSQMDRQLREILDQVDRNYQMTRREIVLPELSEAKAPELHINSAILKAAQQQLQVKLAQGSKTNLKGTVSQTSQRSVPESSSQRF